MSDRYIEELQAFVRSMAYDYGTHRGALVLREGNCCDMTGCIRFFERIDADVQTIMTTGLDQLPATIYQRRDGEWRAGETHFPGVYLSTSRHG